MHRSNVTVNSADNRKAIVVREPYNAKVRDLAYFPKDAFDLFDPEMSNEQKEKYAKLLTARAITFLRQDRYFNDDQLPINVLSFIQLHDGSFSIYVSDKSQEHKILYGRGQQNERTGLFLEQTESYASTLSVEQIQYQYDFAYNRTSVIDSEYYKTLKKTKDQQLNDFLEGRIRIQPARTVSPKVLLPKEPDAKITKKSAALFEVDDIRDKAIARLSTLGNDQKQLETNLELARQKVDAVKDARLKSFALAQFTKLEAAISIKLELLRRNAVELQGTLEVMDAQLIAAWKPRIETAVQIEHAKKLLICAFYNAAIDYFIVIQEKKEGRKEKIKELNTCFEGIIKFREDGTFTTIEDAYNSLSRFSEIGLKAHCENIIQRCNTSKMFGFSFGTSTKLELINSNIQRYAMEHELSEFDPVFKLDGLKISFNFNQEAAARKLDAQDSQTRNELARLSEVLGSRLETVDSVLKNSIVNFETFESNFAVRKDLLETCQKLAVLRNQSPLHVEKIRANIASILAHRSDPAVRNAIEQLLKEAEFETALSNLDEDIQSITSNTDPSSQVLSEDNCDKDKQLNAVLMQRLNRAKNAMRNILAISKTIHTLLENCDIAKRRIIEAQALEAQRAHEQLSAVVTEIEDSSRDLGRSNGSERNLEDHHVSAADAPIDHAARLEDAAEAPRKPEQPGFFKRHLAKLIGGSTGAVIGAGIGAAVGFALLPFTFGLSVPLFAAIGGVVGGAAVGVGVGAGIGAVIDSTPPEPKKPGFFKRHFAKLIGGSTGALVGAGIGAAIGFALLPFTFGLSVPVFAAIGGVIGGAVVGVAVGAGVGAAVDKSSAKKRIANAPVDVANEARPRSFSNTQIYGVIPPGPNRGSVHATVSSVAGNVPSQVQQDLFAVADDLDLRLSQRRK